MSTLADILSSRVKAEVFRLLFGLGGQPLHLRELMGKKLHDQTAVDEEARKEWDGYLTGLNQEAAFNGACVLDFGLGVSVR